MHEMEKKEVIGLELTHDERVEVILALKYRIDKLKSFGGHLEISESALKKVQEAYLKMTFFKI
ncbi:MAG: hypothetical protein ACRDHZ_10330 [Ktedonobacteraceae bacterium]